jgi:hypothetical protein
MSVDSSKNLVTPHDMRSKLNQSVDDYMHSEQASISYINKTDLHPQVIFERPKRSLLHSDSNVKVNRESNDSMLSVEAGKNKETK